MEEGGIPEGLPYLDLRDINISGNYNSLSPVLFSLQLTRVGVKGCYLHIHRAEHWVRPGRKRPGGSYKHPFTATGQLDPF